MQKMTALFVLFLSACVTWTPQSLPGRGRQTELPDKVLVVTAGRDTTILRRPRIEGADLVGNHSRSNEREKRIPLNQISEMSKLTPSPGRTVGAVVGVALIGGIVYEASRPKCTDCIQLFRAGLRFRY